MISIADRPKLKFKNTIANVLALGGFASLLVAVVLPYLKPEFGMTTIYLMLGGMAISTLGIYFANRWVRKPRPETSLDSVLKKFPNSYRLYHYPPLHSEHILLTPYGITLFHVINWEGKFVYKEGRWKELITIGRGIRYPLEQHLGNPSKTALEAEQKMRGYLTSLVGEDEYLPMQSIIVFLHIKSILEIEGSKITICMPNNLRKHIPTKGKRISEEAYIQIQSDLDGMFGPGMEKKV